ncbi:fucose-1-phosphate guanylyltransferase-like [Dysidea avara]|uniref:fucose-1-phosphate guanylyltransferase-like n=1 Tax=Dysidea avara TaxID=196820 RepID=UPI003333964D
MVESDANLSVDCKLLQDATLKKFKQYKTLLQGDDKSNDVPFWDIVVITGGDEEQARSYELQLNEKLSNKEIPLCTKYYVFADPKGPKIGNGGATLHALEQLEQKVPEDYLNNAKILLLHAGGYSQRLPHVSVIGKIFMALPFGNPMYQMLEMLLVMYIDFPAKMNPGVFVTASDIIFLFDTNGDWSFTGAGFTAIGLPESVEIGTTHGVYVPTDMNALRSECKKDPAKTVFMCEVKQFLHKVTPEIMESNGAVIPGTKQVYVDNSYYFDRATAKRLNEFYLKHKPLTCEIDAYGDFLQALGPDANSEYTTNTVNVTEETADLVHIRKLVFDLLKGTNLKVILFHQGIFIHTGTTKEYLYHYCHSDVMKQTCGSQNEVMVKYMHAIEQQVSEDNLKKPKRSLFTDCYLMHSVVEDPESVTMLKDSVIEFCHIESGVAVQENCILSNLHIPANSTIPASSYLHTVAVTVSDELKYATFAFDIYDSMKASVPFERRSDLPWYGTTMGQALQSLHIDSLSEVWPSPCDKYTLWNAKLFPTFSSRKDSANYAIKMIGVLRGAYQGALPKSNGFKVALCDMLKHKSVKQLLDDHKHLKLLIH